MVLFEVAEHELSDAILDVIVAFDALDNASKLPAIFVETTDLLTFNEDV